MDANTCAEVQARFRTFIMTTCIRFEHKASRAMLMGFMPALVSSMLAQWILMYIGLGEVFSDSREVEIFR